MGETVETRLEDLFEYRKKLEGQIKYQKLIDADLYVLAELYAALSRTLVRIHTYEEAQRLAASSIILTQS